MGKVRQGETDSRGDERRRGQIRALHLDEHTSYAELPANRLEAVGENLSVLVASDVEEAVAVLTDRRVDCVVTAYSIDGEAVAAELLDAVRDWDSDLPVVVWDSCDPAAVTDLLEPGATTFVPRTAPVTDDAYAVLANRIASVAAGDERSLFDPLAPSLAAILDAASVPACVLTEGDVPYANPAFCERFETDADLLSRERVISYAVDDVAALRSFLEPPTAGQREATARYPDDTHHDVRVVAASDGPAVLACWFDDGRRVDASPSREEQMLRSLLDNVPIAVYFKDEDSRHVRVSDALTGMAAEEYLANPEGKRHPTAADVHGKTDFDLYKTDHAAPAVEDDREVMETGEPIEAREEYTISDDGEDVWLQTTKAPWEDEHGDVVGVVGITIDITDQMHQGRRRPALDQRLEQFETLIARTLRSAVDEVDRTLRVGSGPVGGDQYDEVLDRLEAVDALLEEMVELARYSQSPTDLVSLDLASVARETWAVTAASGELTVEGEPVVVAEASRLQRLLEATFDIALELGGDDVAVHVAPLDEGFAVEHDGPPLAPEERDALLDGRYTESTTGIGLAMTMVVGVANANGWTPDVSEDATRFEFVEAERT